MEPAIPSDADQEWADPAPRLMTIEERLRSGDPKGALYRLFELLQRWPTHRAGLELAAQVTGQLGAGDEAVLFSRVAADPTDPQALYDLGYLFVGSGFPAVAVGFLRLCLQREPGHPLVRYELAYALFSVGDYEDALELLDALLQDAALAAVETFSAAALRVECLVYLDRLTEAQQAFDDIDLRNAGAEGEAQVDAMAALISRAKMLAQHTPRSQRDWHFIEHGSAILHTTQHSSQMWLPATLSNAYLAAMLRRLESFVLALGRPAQAVQALDREMEPFAKVLATRLSAQFLPSGTSTQEPVLLLAREPGSLARHLGRLRTREDGEDVFCLFLDPRRDYPITPEIVGVFAADLSLPWTPGDLAASADLLDCVLQLDGDDGDLMVVDRYYSAVQELLTYGNYDRHPARRTFTALRSHA